MSCGFLGESKVARMHGEGSAKRRQEPRHRNGYKKEAQVAQTVRKAKTKILMCPMLLIQITLVARKIVKS